MAESINEQVNDQNRSGSNKDQLDQRYNKPLESFPPPPYMEPPGQDYRQFQQSTRLHQENVRPPPYFGLTSQSPVQYQAGTQIIYIQTVPLVSHVYKDYNGKLSVKFGVINILLVTIAIILNGIAFARQLVREYDWIGNVVFLICPAVFCGLFIYLTAAFAIASGKQKTRCLIIAHLVLSIFGSVFGFIFFGLSIGALWYEVDTSKSDNVCLAIAIVWILFSVTIFITVTWGSGLCCKVVCCRSSPVEIAPLMVGGTPLSSTTNRW